LAVLAGLTAAAVIVVMADAVASVSVAPSSV
jgi:hypothetical protein